jgi:multiple sugar transport system permease protein
MKPKSHTKALQYLALAGYLVFLGFPLVWLLSTSFKQTKGERNYKEVQR